MSDELTVIVPTLGADETAIPALASIAAQERPVHLIVVVDGRKLERVELELLRTFAPECDLIESPERLGPLGARLSGLDRARSPWVSFLDADDVLHPRFGVAMVSECVRTGADIASCGVARIWPRRRPEVRSYHLRAGTCTGNEAASLLVDLRFSGGQMMNRVFARSLVSSLTFDEIRSLRFNEDYLFLLKVLGRADRVVRIPQCLYGAVENPVSVTRSATKQERTEGLAAAYLAAFDSGEFDVELLQRLYRSQLHYSARDPQLFFRQVGDQRPEAMFRGPGAVARVWRAARRRSERAAAERTAMALDPSWNEVTLNRLGS